MPKTVNHPATHILCDAFGAGDIASFTTFVVGPNKNMFDYHTAASDAVEVPERTLGTDLIQNLTGIMFHPQLFKGGQHIIIYLTSPHIYNIVQAILSCKFDINAIACMLPGELRGTVYWLVLGIVDCIANNATLSFRQISRRDADSINEFCDLGTLTRTRRFPIGGALISETLRVLNLIQARPELHRFSHIVITILNGASTKSAIGYTPDTPDIDCDPVLVISQARELEKRRLDADQVAETVTSSYSAASSSPSVYGATPARPSCFGTSPPPFISEDGALPWVEKSENGVQTAEPSVMSGHVDFGSLPSQASQRPKASRRVVISPIRLGIRNVYSARSPGGYSPVSPSPVASRANASIMAVLDFPVSPGPVASGSRLESLLGDWELEGSVQEEDGDSVVDRQSSPPPARPRDQTGLCGRIFSPTTTPSGRVLNKKRRLSFDFEDFSLSNIPNLVEESEGCIASVAERYRIPGHRGSRNKRCRFDEADDDDFDNEKHTFDEDRIDEDRIDEDRVDEAEVSLVLRAMDA